MSHKLFGWELMYKSVESSFQSSNDVMVAFIHFTLLKNNFKCIGTDGNPSEFLPEGWNQKGDNYKLRYIHNEKLYIIQAVISEDFFIVNFLDTNTRKLTNVALKVDECVTMENRTLQNAIIKPIDNFVYIENELVHPMIIDWSKLRKPLQNLTFHGKSGRLYFPNSGAEMSLFPTNDFYFSLPKPK